MQLETSLNNSTRMSGRSFETDEVRQLKRIPLCWSFAEMNRTWWPLRSQYPMEGGANGD